MIYVDSNVIIDIFADDPNWSGWSAERLREAREQSAVVTGTIVAAELSHRASSLDALSHDLSALGIDLVDMDLESAWHAGRAYREYRRRGGDRPSLLADFLIGGHATALGATILTRDARRYRSYFPDISLITPKETE